MSTPFITRPAIEKALVAAASLGTDSILVSGPPGCGKSRLAEQWQATLDEVVVTLDLAEAADAPAMLAATALALDCDPESASIAHALRALGQVTIVVDDFDRAAKEGTALLESWREAAPQARFVITCRQRLDLPDVAVVEVGPMPGAQAVELFVAVAKRVRPSFVADAALTRVIEDLVEELDRIPLAIELAASRINALAPAEMLRRMPERFRILRGRNATLRGAIELSWELLDDFERNALAQTVAFRGGFGAAAFEAVVDCGDDGPWVVDVLEQLVEKSLVVAATPDGPSGPLRFHLLSSVRQFVMERGEAVAEAENRHAEYYLDLCRELTFAMRREGGAAARMQLRRELPNLEAAFERAASPATVVDIALTLDKAFRLHEPNERWAEALGRAREVVEPDDADRLARVLRSIGELRLLRGDIEGSVVALSEARDVARTGELWTILGWVDFLLGEAHRRGGRPRQARSHFDEAIEVGRTRGVPYVERMALGHLAGSLVDVGDLDEARSALVEMNRLPASDDNRDEARLLKRVAYVQHYLGNVDEQVRLTHAALALARTSGDQRLEALCIHGLGDVAFVRGQLEDAREAWGEALELHRLHGSVELEGALLGNLGNLEHRLGHLTEARDAIRAALALHAASGARPYEAVAWFGLGVLEFEQLHLDDARASLQRAAELNRQMGNDSDLGSALLVLAWVEELDGRVADGYFEEARAAFQRAGDEEWVPLCNPTGPHPVDASNTTVQNIARALSGETDVDRSRLHVRAALTRAGGASGSAPPAPRTPKLLVSSAGDWFEIEGRRVDLGRRRAPRLILAGLASLRAEAPGTALDVHEVFAMGWPNERATVEAAADRVYWAIRTLRKLGLEEFLVTRGEGYTLDPDAPISIR